jgi:hypothetical protein
MTDEPRAGDVELDRQARLAADGPFFQTVNAYRQELNDPGFAVELAEALEAAEITPSAARQARRMAALHEMAAERFEEQALVLAAKAEWADAYERGAYDDPPINTPMLVALIALTVGFSVTVLLANRVAGLASLAMSLALDMVFVVLWRQPPYHYTGGHRRPWDEAASLASESATRARARLSYVTDPGELASRWPLGLRPLASRSRACEIEASRMTTRLRPSG